jgi:DNA invertase Pin-like site-specific DNA recombinase
MKRALAVQRISRDTEASSALTRQDEALTLAVRRRAYVEAGRVVDATVSGAVNLDQRPSLRKWLTDPLVHEWDVLMVTEQDRITRDDMHWWHFVDWILKNGKDIEVLDDPMFDIHSEAGRMLAGIKAAQAAKYRRAVQAKQLDRTQFFRENRLWNGGVWPFGYRAEVFSHLGEPRKRLAVDPCTSQLVREAYERIVHGRDTVYAVARDWNARGVPAGERHSLDCDPLAQHAQVAGADGCDAASFRTRSGLGRAARGLGGPPPEPRRVRGTPGRRHHREKREGHGAGQGLADPIARRGLLYLR